MYKQFQHYQRQRPGVLGRLGAFIGLGMFIVALIIGVILLWYLLIYGAVIGIFLFGISYIINKLRKKKQADTPARQGKTYDHDQF